MPPVILHPSHLTMFEGCAYQFELVHMKGFRKPPGFVAHIGSGVDESVNRNMLNKIEHDELMSVDELQEIARKALLARWDQEGVLLADDEKAKGEDRIKAESIDTTVRLAALHRNELAPMLNPAVVQDEWFVTLPGYDFCLSGTKDLVEADGSIDDLKTTDKTVAQAAESAFVQLTTYSLETWARTQKLPPKVRLHLLRRKIPKKNPPIEIYEGEPDYARFKPLLRRYQSMTRHIEAGLFQANGRHTWRCQPKYCGFYPCKNV